MNADILFNIFLLYCFIVNCNFYSFFSVAVPPDAINEFIVYALCLLIKDEILTQEKYNMLGQKVGCLTFQSASNILQVCIFILFPNIYINILLYSI